MPGSILDLIQSAMGRPDPATQIAARLGQAPGQPGSPQGPQPLELSAGRGVKVPVTQELARRAENVNRQAVCVASLLLRQPPRW